MEILILLSIVGYYVISRWAFITLSYALEPNSIDDIDVVFLPIVGECMIVSYTAELVGRFLNKKYNEEK